jgi:hypothetical protein
MGAGVAVGVAPGSVSREAFEVSPSLLTFGSVLLLSLLCSDFWSRDAGKELRELGLSGTKRLTDLKSSPSCGVIFSNNFRAYSSTSSSF